MIIKKHVHRFASNNSIFLVFLILVGIEELHKNGLAELVRRTKRHDMLSKMGKGEGLAFRATLRAFHTLP